MALNEFVKHAQNNMLAPIDAFVFWCLAIGGIINELSKWLNNLQSLQVGRIKERYNILNKRIFRR